MNTSFKLNNSKDDNQIGSGKPFDKKAFTFSTAGLRKIKPNEEVVKVQLGPIKRPSDIFRPQSKDQEPHRYFPLNASREEAKIISEESSESAPINTKPLAVDDIMGQ